MRQFFATLNIAGIQLAVKHVMLACYWLLISVALHINQVCAK